MKTTLTKKPNAFSLIELLTVLTIMSIMAALVINSFTNAAQDSRDVVSRQQQAVIKGALDNMISQYMVSGANGRSKPKTVEEARRYYMYNDYAAATPAEKRDNLERLALLQPYLDDETYDHFATRSVANGIQSAAMVKTKQHVDMEDWAPTTSSNRSTYPKVKLSAGNP
ncbi:MAG: prepilin-type N-terminal cleavage/methylation domain-containing protein [Pseudoalteromonas tetraodonis]|jgi:prepilin-type N-terminal cleavage/methylation domain-containing protein